jgi:hypothetical protein
MTDGGKLKACSYYVVRYAPNVARDEGVNIGVLLYCAEDRYLGCLFTDDLGPIRRMDRHADRRLIGGLQQAFEQQIEEHEADQEAYLKSLCDSLSNAVRIEDPRPCLLTDPQTEIEELYTRAVGVSPLHPSHQDTRLKIKQRLTAALMRAGVWERIEKRIPAARWTKPGDAFTFDYGYRPNGRIHFVHALSLKRDTQLGKTLVYTLDCVRRKEEATLTAVVEAVPEGNDAPARATHDILQEGRIRVAAVAELETLTESIRHDLRM